MPDLLEILGAEANVSPGDVLEQGAYVVVGRKTLHYMHAELICMCVLCTAPDYDMDRAAISPGHPLHISQT